MVAYSKSKKETKSCIYELKNTFKDHIFNPKELKTGMNLFKDAKNIFLKFLRVPLWNLRDMATYRVTSSLERKKFYAQTYSLYFYKKLCSPYERISSQNFFALT